MWLIVYACCVEKGLKACWIIVDVTSCLCGCELYDVMKMVISSLFVWTCHLHYSETWLWQVYVHWERMRTYRGCTILRDVSRTAMHTIFWGTYRTPWCFLLSRVRVLRRDRCMDRYVINGSRTERQRVFITRSDMHHYTWHCIPLHCTYLSLVNLILCFADLVIAFCGTCDCWILSLLLRIYNLLKCCCWGYVICCSFLLRICKFLEVLLLRISNLFKCWCWGYVIC